MNEFVAASNLQAIFAGKLARPTITLWNRLEGRPRTHDFDRALRAEVRDALWMLTKQWQMGEFRGDDAGSPVTAKVHVDTTRLTKYQGRQRPGRGFRRRRAAGGKGRAAAGAPDARRHEDGGRHPARRRTALAAADRGHRARHRGEIPRRARLRDARPGRSGRRGKRGRPRDMAASSALAGRADRRRRAARAPAGGRRQPRPRPRHARQCSLRGTGRGGGNRVAGDLPAALLPAGKRCRHAWLPERLEYAFAASPHRRTGPRSTSSPKSYSTVTSTGTTSTSNPVPAVSGGARTRPLRRRCRRSTPRVSSRRRYSSTGCRTPGGGGSRTARTNFGDIDPDTTEINKLLVMEFGLVYANDWFLLPITVPAGTVAEIRGLSVTNVFGETHLGRGRRRGLGRGLAALVHVQRWPPGAAPTSRPTAACSMLPSVPKIQEGPPLRGGAR